MSEENKSLNEELEVSEAAESEESVKPEKTDKKKIGIIAGIAAGVVALIVALILIFGGSGDEGQQGEEGGDGDSEGGSQTGDAGNGDHEEEEVDPERADFIAGLGGVSETFEGALSEESYPSADKAAEAFVADELSGEGIATVHSVESKGQLSAGEIEALDLPEDVVEGYDAIEKIEVVYEVNQAVAFSRSGRSAQQTDKSERVVVYVIKYGPDWKYFAPMPETGDTISKSYYDSVFNADKYKNCTLLLTNSIGMVISADGESFAMNIALEQLIKHDNGKVYLEQKTVMDYDGEKQEMTIYAYLEEIDGESVCYVKMDGLGVGSDWIVADLKTIGFQSPEELAPFYDQYLDYTYFTKTNYGFALADENARSYFTQALSGSLEDLGVSFDDDNLDIDMFAEYYVSQGVLSGMRVDAAIDLSMKVEGVFSSISETVVSEVKCSDYGTTVVERPEID